MKFLLLMLLSFSVAATDLTLPVKSVYDGDTITSEVKCLPLPLSKVSIRLLNVDTPELRQYKCIKEKELATKARLRVIEVIGASKEVLVKDVKWDKYGGRILGNVMVNNINLSDMLVSEGLGRVYTGGVKKGWCD